MSKLSNDSLVSITIIFLNGERFIREAIESVVAQTYKNWELFLVDDGSTDGSSRIAVHYAKQYQGKVRYLEHAGHRNLGKEASRNVGITNANGEYLAFLDADDVWLPNALERQVAALDYYPQASMVYGSAQYWYGWTGNPEDKKRDFRDFVEVRGGAKPDSLLEPPTLLTALLRDGRAVPCICSVLMRCEVVRAVGGFEEQFRGQYEDQALYVKLALQAPVLAAGECWSRYRQHPDSSWYMAQRTGEDKQARRFFMVWLARYLREQRIEEAEIWQLIRRELPHNRRTVAQAKVLDVSKNKPAEQLFGFNIDSPRPGQQGDSQELDLKGWVLSRDSPAVAVELVHEGVVVRRVPVDDFRADVASAYPWVRRAENSGFSTTLGVSGMAELELGLRAVLQDQCLVPLGTIRAQRRWNVDAAEEPAVVSVVIPCYNQAHFLGEAIESVLAQSYPLFEVVVVDDGSTDDTSEVAARYPGVRCIRQHNQGLAAARNAGLRESKGGYLVFLDADDRLLPEALEVGLECLESRPECAFASGHYRNIAADGSPLPTPEQPYIEKEQYLEILRANYIITPAVVMHRRAALDSVDGFNTSPNVKNTEDYELCLRIAKQFAVHCHGKIIAEYRLHDTSMSHDCGTMLKSTLNVLRSQWKHVEGEKRYEDAYEKGVRAAQSYYGEPLIDAVRVYLQEREWRRALQGVLVLGQYYPEGLESLLEENGSRLLALGESTSERQPNVKECTRIPAVGNVDFGSLRRVTPVSREWGFDRGLPVDRYYIEDFLVRRARDIRGHVLEIGDDLYTRKYGGEHVTASDVLHVTEGNPQATIVADLTSAEHIPSNTFDCVIFTQTLHIIYDVRPTIQTLRRILKPGGVLLATFPGISKIEKAYPWGEWYWAFTTPSARRLFEEGFSADSVEVDTYGNVLAAISFLHGLAAKELSREELDYLDPDYEVLIALRVVKKGRNVREESYMQRSNWMKGLLGGLKDTLGAGRRNQRSSPDERTVANLTASPNPVPAGPVPGPATIEWSTGDDSEGQVYLRVGEEPETLFAQGARGSQEATFIGAGPTYEFRLYSGTVRESLLASVEVTRSDEAFIDATPNPVPAGPVPGPATIEWSTGDDSEGQVYLRVGEEPETLFAQGARGSQEATFIGAGPTYEFRLYSGTVRESLLASVEVTRNRE